MPNLNLDAKMPLPVSDYMLYACILPYQCTEQLIFFLILKLYALFMLAYN